MFGVTFENVRSLISAGHVRTSAYSAAVTAFGDYNKELYREYGLFGYGGAEGKNVSDLEFAYQRVLFENLSAVPVKKDKQYVDLFGYRDIDYIYLDEKAAAVKLGGSYILFLADGTVEYEGRFFVADQLSPETLEWLEYYNSLPEEGQRSISMVPHDLIGYIGLEGDRAVETDAQN